MARTIRDLYPQAFVIADNIKSLSALFGTTDEDIAKVIGGSAATVARRKKEPWKRSLVGRCLR